MDAKTQAWLDQEDARIAAVIREHGWAITYVGGESCSYPGCNNLPGDDPPFAYTTGLFGLGHPELLVFGLSPHDSAGLLNSLGDRVREGESLLPGMMITVGEWPHRVIPEEVPNPGEIVFEANRFYQRPSQASVPVLQLSYDDARGRFPWDEGFDSPETQPRPGTFQA
ncbi:MAG: DUF4262 domain-containing protein [Acidimicrobiia bacterium]